MRTSIRIIALAVMGTFYGCAADDSANASNNTDTPVAQTAVSPTPTAPAGENECKICDFDYTAYKGELNRDEINGLLLALNDEYSATATYEQVNADHNNPLPFVNIVESERRHADMLKELFSKYELPVPENPWTGETPKSQTVAEACKAGIEGEIMNRDLYAGLFKSTERTDILDTYKYLQRASEENHLPAFERCGGTGGGRGPGVGGPGRGRGSSN